jgi:uncharacterized repeat protein (TIGR01451 family)
MACGCAMFRRTLVPCRLAALGTAAVVVALVAGCTTPFATCNHHVPKIDPTGQRLFTHDAPFHQVPGPINKHNTTAVMVSPARIIAPVGSEVVVQAAVCGQDKALMAGEEVEWSIAPNSAGFFVQAGETGHLDWLHHVGYRTRKVDNTYLVSATSAKFIMLNRGTPDSGDDVPILRGQAWSTVTSPTEGTTFVTAVSPKAYSWDQRKQTATIYWIDAQWTLPPPAINPSGTRHPFTTTLVRNTNKCPLVGYRVKYEITGGPPAGFAPDGVQSIELPTNSLGQATVEIFQTQPSAGTNTVNISIIRPADWPGGDGSPLVVGTGATQKTWTAASSGGLMIDKSGPSEVAVGGTATYRIVIRNPSDLTARGIVVTDVVPTGMTFLGSTPQGAVMNNNLSWQLGDLAAGQSRQIELSFQATTPAVVNQCATVRTADGATAQDCVATTITQPLVELTLSGPPQAAVGDEVTFTATITNRASTPATGLVLIDRFDAGLRHDYSPSPIENRELGSIEPGGMRKVNVRLRVTQPGRWCNTMDLTGDNGIRGSAQSCVTAVQPSTPVTVPPIVTPPPVSNNPPPGTAAPVLVVQKTGPARAGVGDLITFTITVENRGTVAATNLKVVDNYDLALKPTRASDGWQLAGNDIFWTLPQLLPGQIYERKVECQCQSPATQACNRITATCQEGTRQDAQTCLEITGQRQALSVNILERRDPVSIGTEVQYDVRVTNGGAVADREVMVVVTLPNEMTPAAGSTGPTAFVLDGRTLKFAPLAEIRPGESVTYQIRAVPRQAGSALLRADVTSSGSPTPISASETTNVIAQ